MAVNSYFRGNEIIFNNNQWLYKDTQLSVAGTYKERPCGNCGKGSTKEGHDACLGILIGVMNACCGHGKESEAYIQFLDGKDIRGKDAVIIMGILKKYRKEEKIMSAKKQIEKLANYIMKHFPEEITGGGAGDVAIRILEKVKNGETLHIK